MDWSSLIGKLLETLLGQCWSQTTDAGTDPQAYLRRNYNPGSNTFTESLVKSTMRQTRRAIARAKKGAPKAERKTCPDYGPAAIREMAIAKLLAAMNSPKAVVSAAIHLANSLPEIVD